MDVTSTESELRALMVASSDGDAAAYRTLLERLGGKLRAYFRGQLNRINRGVVEAEDLVQETLLAIHTRRHTYDPSQPLTPWVSAIARYRFIDHLRQTKASTKEVPIEEAGDIRDRDDLAAAVESALDLEKLMSGISPKARQV